MPGAYQPPTEPLIFPEMRAQGICASGVWLHSRTLAHQADQSIYKNNRNERS